ncbi:MAG: hypothetical protein J6O50_02650 [Ruminiclostridium sp.]|nr:hypothetical protein [Ruminiclostridium sp.]
MPRKKITEEKSVAAVPAIKAAEKAVSVTEKPKRKYTRKTAVKEAALEADKKVAAEPVKEVPAPIIKTETKEKTSAKEDKPKRKYTRKTTATAKKAESSVTADAKPNENKEVASVVSAPVIAEEKPRRKYTRRSAAPKAEKKAPATKKSVKKNDTAPASASSFILQYGGGEYDIEKIRESVAADSKGKIRGKIKSLDIYVKPEDHAVYYVVNGKDSFKIDL